ncbi:2'-5' RNA ligase family protein [Mucilaginibacter sp. UR6-1]|uniref:2'-5' RNA ligase family protein n=1 Tax=Mucilaginibacter sp. UR6-1 TaxID=1435643 RepID=UPI001E29090B|nr:2'-5' RNA ligase family protein [Mucilaginibacter sp. UR6-1]MCC8410244.1 2'-5' RNA ligase family protein [Mucilaginibacter sp. UR6-1]
MEGTQPLILTLKLDNNAQMFFNDLRKQYFPPGRNFIDAHLTLFHQLPPGQHEVFELLYEIGKQRQSFTVNVSRIVSIGNGVAFKCESDELQKLHQYLQQQWRQWLIPQDRQKLWPHITIQNKVSADVAQATLNRLLATFTPFSIKVTGFSLWKYLGGPWEFAEEFLFQ